MKNRKLLLLVFLCIFFIVPRTYFYVNHLQEAPKKIANQMLELQTDSVKIDGNSLKMTGKLQKRKYLIYYSLKSPEEKAYWQEKKLPNRVVIDGEAENFEPARNLNGFDERKYYQSLGYSQKILARSINIIKQRKLTQSDFRHWLIWKIDQRYSKRLASYIKALIIGYKDGQFNEFTASYKSAGLLHLFTLSGLHIQFYLGGIHLLLKRMSLTRGGRLLLLCITGIFLILMTGGSFSTIRAVLSFLLAFSCLTFQIRLSQLDQWSLMLFLLFFCFPLVLWSVGAQLSLYFALLLLYIGEFHKPAWQQMLIFSFLSIPILIYSFSEWSIAGGIFTLLLFPIFEWLILPGCILLFFGCFLPLPHLFEHLFEGLFQLLEKILSFFTISNITLGRPSFLVFILLFILVFLMIDRIKYQRKFLMMLGLFVILLVTISFSTNGMVVFIDVGQGDSIFIKLPFKKETFLIDTGGRLNFNQERWQKRQQKHLSDYNLLPFLKSVGCTKLDHVLVTHNDADHMGELAHILNEVKVKNLYLAKGSQSELSELLKPLEKTKIHLVKRGDTIGRHLKLNILSPEISQGENNDSLVTYFEVNRQRFLLTGDLETIGEEKLIQNYPNLRTDFLKVGHHGSNTSTGDLFLRKLQPKYSIISVGKKNRYGHPTNETLKKLVNTKVYRTDQQGMIYYQWSALTKRGKIKLLIDFLE